MSEDWPSDELEDLIHDVNSGCSSLREAAIMLRKATPAEARELLTMMDRQVRNLAKNIASAGNPRPQA